MATRYVDTAGTDSGAGGVGAPWKTLTYALANATSGDTISVNAGTYTEATASTPDMITLAQATADGKTLTIQTTSGSADVTFSTASTTNCMIRSGVWASTSSFTFTNIKFIPSVSLGAAGSHGVINTTATGSAAVSLIFSGCTFDSASHDSRLWREGSSHTNCIYSFTNCTWNASACTVAGVAPVSFANSYDSVTMTGNTVTGNTQNVVTVGKSGAAPITTATFTNNTFTSSTLAGGAITRELVFETNVANSSKIAKFVFTGNTINTNRVGLDVRGGVTSAYIANNTVNCSGANAGIGLRIGADSADATSTNIDYAYVSGNTTVFTTGRSHGIMVGRYILAGEFCYNTASGADYGIVAKGCAKVYIHHNVVTACYSGGIYVRGAQDCTFSHNSIYRPAGGSSSELFAILTDSIDDGGVYTDPARNKFFDNLFYLDHASNPSGYGAVMITDARHVGTTSIATNSYHRNIYRLPTSFPFLTTIIDPTTTNYTLAEARTQWATYGTVDKLSFNDDSTADPLFVSSTNLNVLPGSPARGTSGTNYTQAGAYGYPNPAKAANIGAGTIRSS